MSSSTIAQEKDGAEQPELITPPTNLQHLAHKTPGDNKLDMSVLIKAEIALKNISGQYAEWMTKEIATLRALRDDIQQNGLTQDNSAKVFYLMQNLKDCAATFGYPYIAQIAASLCEAIEQIPFETMPRDLVNNHLNAVFAIVNENAKGETSFVAGNLATRLSDVTKDYLKSLQK